MRGALRQRVAGTFFFFFPSSAERVTKVDALGKHLWQGMLRAVMHSPDSWPRVASAGWMSRSGVGGWGAGGGVAGWGARAGAEARGFKKAEPGVWWAEWCVFSSPSPSAPACFSRRGRRGLPTFDGDEWRQGTGSIGLYFSSACIVCAVSRRRSAEALINSFRRLSGPLGIDQRSCLSALASTP